ncbi:hypothetical protein NP233_g9901 [Leucocoprinus birnbaumii]|uniref:Terpene synthase n=1 Tax=Leucocoprinus birnbaumii TaxID=56174 RepID=A0AAD5YSG0_9AGAR|nr:hypothetical protein NP233_g9901 [Leucocoprinus birnbaumii]
MSRSIDSMRQNLRLKNIFILSYHMCIPIALFHLKRSTRTDRETEALLLQLAIIPPLMSFHLPDIHHDWPFPRGNNPNYDEVAEESMKWLESFRIFSEDRQKSFRAIMPGLLASMAYPDHSRPHFRSACDLMAVLFAVDEISDRLAPEEARDIAESALNALRVPESERVRNEHPLVDLHRSFWARTLQTASETVKRRFIASYEDYVRAMIQEADDRQQKRVRKSMADYLALRRYTGAIKPSFDLLLLPSEISDEVLDMPVVKELEMIAIEMVAVANDIVSFNVEQARGDIHNLIIVIMDGDEKIDVQMAMDMVGEWYRKRGRDFVECLNQLPVLLEGEGDSEIHRLHEYARGLGNWVTANYEWSFECRRFFGEHTMEVKENVSKVGVFSMIGGLVKYKATSLVPST